MRNISELFHFLNNTMSMTDIYQPAVILHLLEQGGSSTKRDLSRILSGYDENIQEYYEKVLMRWPKITLTKHDIVNYDKGKVLFSLNFDLRDYELVELAKKLCEQKIRDWIEKKSDRRNNPRVGASIRYRVLKAARGKCELCGISSKISPIDIDHIIPQNKADEYSYVLKDNVRIPVDDERNLQALCYRCNRAKRDQDTTDFRQAKSRLTRTHSSIYSSNTAAKSLDSQLTKEKLMGELYEKLVDEHARLIYKDSEEPISERIVDMMEVLVSIAKVEGQTEKEILTLMQQRRDKLGSFDTKIYSIDDIA